jgi:hypothetical protein
MRKALDAHPAVMLFSHRSNLDGLVLTVAMKENQASARLHVRRHQHGLRADGAPNAAIGRHLHPAQHRR